MFIQQELQIAATCRSLIFLLKYDPNGNLKWTESYWHSGTPEDFIYKVLLDKYSNIFVTGISLGIGTSYDIATIKYSQTIGIDPTSELHPSEFTLYQNFPNPFNPVTKIKYNLVRKGHVKIKVYNSAGISVQSFVNKIQPAGSYEIIFNGSKYPSGIYFYKLEVDGKNYGFRK